MISGGGGKTNTTTVTIATIAIIARIMSAFPGFTRTARATFCARLCLAGLRAADFAARRGAFLALFGDLLDADRRDDLTRELFLALGARTDFRRTFTSSPLWYTIDLCIYKTFG